MPRKDGVQSNFFIAILPPSPVYEEAQELKLYFREQYKSKASLNSPPHITLHMPFRWKEKKEEDLIGSLEKFTLHFSPFSLSLKNFSCFSPKVIFIDVTTNPSLNELQKELHKFCKRELNVFNADYKEQAFYPHLTLAFRDLKKPAFQKAWDEFKDKNFKADFVVEKITLLKHTGRVWRPFKDFVFPKTSVDTFAIN
jgi:2'-5' RNA ligase